MRAATEKEPSTRVKDKKDQIKDYFIYPKPPVLDMKWENRDINVAEWANIPKFSKLDDIVTTLRPFELFFDDSLMTVHQCTVIERERRH